MPCEEQAAKKSTPVNSKLKTSYTHQLADDVNKYCNNRRIQKKEDSKLGVKLELVLCMCPRVRDGGCPVQSRNKGHGRRQTFTQSTSAYI